MKVVLEKELPRAMLKSARELPSMFDRIVFDVEKSAITTITIAPVLPNRLRTTSASGLSDAPNSRHGMALTTQMAISV